MDSLLLSERTIAGQQVLLAVVCDGVGSMEDGGFASSYTIRALATWFSECNSANNIPQYLSLQVKRINDEIVNIAQDRGLKTATTLAALIITDGVYFTINAGDSRIYFYDNTSFGRITTDDITESGKLTRCVGHKIPMDFPWFKGDAREISFLLCSDGLYKRVPEDEIRMVLANMNKHNIKECPGALAQSAVQNGERDNITIAIITH
jgi:serine/threonine protein phosphatase PrpC